MPRVAAIQINGGDDCARNLQLCGDMIEQAVREGARFVVTPENTDFIVRSSKKRLSLSSTEQDHPAIPYFTSLAREHGIWIAVGSLSIKISETQVQNRSYVFEPSGDVIATYNKLHMFDVDLGNGEVYRESDIVKAGDKAVVVELPWAKLGLSICYDVRFPHLYRDLAKHGAEIMIVPAAFTMHTGRLHWETLLRARAIETGSYVIAAGQTGHHGDNMDTYGHSMVISPWGDVAEECGAQPGVMIADLDLDVVREARQSIPSLQHDVTYSF